MRFQRRGIEWRYDIMYIKQVFSFCFSCKFKYNLKITRGPWVISLTWRTILSSLSNFFKYKNLIMHQNKMTLGNWQLNLIILNLKVHVSRINTGWQLPTTKGKTQVYFWVNMHWGHKIHQITKLGDPEPKNIKLFHCKYFIRSMLPIYRWTNLDALGGINN